MAKKSTGNGGKSGSTRLVSPLYESGTTVGPVSGPKGGLPVRDPFNYLNSPGQSAPGGSMTDRGPDASPPRQPK